MKISTYIFSIVLTALLLFNSTTVSLTYAYYNIDPVGFIEALCENQDKPELNCNGKCHLKKVSKTQDKNQKTPTSIIDFKELILFSHAFETVVFNDKEYVKKTQSIPYNNLYVFTSIDDCFHPPQV